MTKLFIDGSAGTTGLRIHERLAAREDIERIEISEERRKDPEAVRQCMREADVAFLCLPDAAAREAVALAKDEDVILIDTSTAHRTASGWTYGFPELSPAHREAIRQSRRIAVPGCHATGMIALVYPLIVSGILSRDYPVSCFSLTGYSGGGKSMIADYEADDRDPELAAPRIYGLSQEHKHRTEMRTVTGLSREPLFVPAVADYYSGMLVTVPLDTSCLSGSPGVERIHDVYAVHFGDEPLIAVQPPGEEAVDGGFLGSNTRAGWDGLEIFVTGNAERVQVSARFDNLGKGASGAAIQCLNLVLGCEETKGLRLS